MPRPPKIRATYVDDTIKLRRLRDAIDRDKSLPVKWQKTVVGKLDDVILLLIQRDLERG